MVLWEATNRCPTSSAVYKGNSFFFPAMAAKTARTGNYSYIYFISTSRLPALLAVWNGPNLSLKIYFISTIYQIYHSVIRLFMIQYYIILHLPMGPLGGGGVVVGQESYTGGGL